MSRSARLVALGVTLALLTATPAMAAPLTFPALHVDGFPRGGPPNVTAATWVLYDETSDSVLASFAADQQRPVASITKIMTALLAIERRDLDEVVTISSNAANTGEREIDLVAGEQLPLGALVKAAMIHSANDAATAIAEYVGGSVESFVVMMNARAQELGMNETSFTNPHGLDAPDHYSSARDMLDLSVEAMKYEDFRNMVRSQLLVFPDGPDGSQRRGTTTNLMLGEFEGASGIKTGFTSSALLTMVSTAIRDGRRLYAVVLGSEGRRAHFADASALLDYGFGQLGIYGTLSTDNPYVSLQERVSPGPIYTETNLETFVHLAGQGLMTSPPSPSAPIPDAEPIPVTVVERRPEEAPDGVLSAAGYWWSLVVGQ